MKSLFFLLTTLLTALPTSALVVEYIQDGSFEQIPKRSLNTEQVRAGSWRLLDSVVFASNPLQPQGFKTPYGDKYVYYRNTRGANIRGTAEQSLTLPTDRNVSLSYAYRVFENELGTRCTLNVNLNYGDGYYQGLDSFVPAKVTNNWISRSPSSLKSPAENVTVSFGLFCYKEPGHFKMWKIGLDEVSISYSDAV